LFSEPDLWRLIGITCSLLFINYYLITSVLQGALHFVPLQLLEKEFKTIGEDFHRYRPILNSMHLANRIGLHISFISLLYSLLLLFFSSSVLTPSNISFHLMILTLVLFVLVFCFHFIPFYLGRLLSIRMLIFFFPALKIQYYCYFPLVKGLQAIYTQLGILGNAQMDSPERMEQDIISKVTEGEFAGFLAQQEAKMIESILELRGEKITKIMIPRNRMLGIEAQTSFAEVLDIFKSSNYSRLPLYENSKDNIIGILYAKDLFKYWNSPHSPLLKEIARKPYYVPESKLIGDLLRDFSSRRQMIAVVLDEFGGTAGIVTIKDIIERLIGLILEEEVSPTPPLSLETEAPLPLPQLLK
jgi:CBS domain containing-hemolysin-like protein